jgi:hypothetical protein
MLPEFGQHRLLGDRARPWIAAGGAIP